MPGRVIQPTQAPEFVRGKPNQVISITEAKILPVAYTNADGEKAVALVIQFGVDTEDGQPGVYILAEQEQMKEQLKIANPTIKKGVRDYLASRGVVTPDTVPDSISTAVSAKRGGIMDTEIGDK